MLQALLLAGIDRVGDFEGRCLALVEDAELDRVDLDLAGRELRVLVRAAALHDAAHSDHPLAPQRACEVMRGLRPAAVAGELRVEDELRDAFTIPQIDEDAPAVIAV